MSNGRLPSQRAGRRGSGFEALALAAALCTVAALDACSSGRRHPTRPLPPSAAPMGGEETAWLLEGSDEERFARVAKHLRGFDVAMKETGYRYGELYWAGRDRNWQYADYQLRKIETAIANGLERRPRRAASAQMLNGPLAAVRSAIAARNPENFDRAFQDLTATCNACHEAERVSFVAVGPPEIRLSPVRPVPSADHPPQAPLRLPGRREQR